MQRGFLQTFDQAFDEKPMDEATVNAAVDWLMEQGASLFDVCVAFASAPCPEKGWQWILARFDRLMNGEEKRTPGGLRRCNEIRKVKMNGDYPIYHATNTVSVQRESFIWEVLSLLRPEIEEKEVEKAAKQISGVAPALESSPVHTARE